MADSKALDAWRSELRAGLMARRQAASAADREYWSGQIAAHLRAALSAPGTLTIGSYTPFRGEPDLRPLVEQWRLAGATIALPVVVGRGLPMEFRSWWPGAPMRRGAFSLPEPDGTALVAPQLVLMPPVGFDAEGYRLGYGGGYFDRTLAAMPAAPVKVGVAFELARIDSIDPQAYDVVMDFIVTERGIHRVGPAGLALVNVPAAFSAALGAKRAAPNNDARSDDSQDAIRPYASSPCYGHESGIDD